jgi:hypothetical protein
MNANLVLKCYLFRHSTASTITYRLPSIPRHLVEDYIRHQMPGWELGAIFEDTSNEKGWPNKGQEHAE